MMTNKNTIVINFTQLESEVRKKGRLFNTSVEGGGKECILLYGAMAGRLFWLFSTLPSPVAPPPLRSKQLFQNIAAPTRSKEQKSLERQLSQLSNREAITPALCPWPREPHIPRRRQGGNKTPSFCLWAPPEALPGRPPGQGWERRDLMIRAFPSPPSLPSSWNPPKATSHTQSLSTASQWPSTFSFYHEIVEH